MQPPYHKESNIKANHGFFGRQGGISKGIFSSLNCTFRDEDPKENVLSNRNIALSTIGLDNAPLILGIQKHTSIPKFVDSFCEPGVCDALVTTSKNLALGILTADCCPILLEDHENGVIGAVHAGWKGAITGIIENTVSLMREKGARNISTALGPCLWLESFDVKEDFILALKQHSPFDSTPFIINNKFDSTSYITHRLGLSGITNISPSPFDTYSNPDRFFSYRQRTHRLETNFGGQLSVIGMPS